MSATSPLRRVWKGHRTKAEKPGSFTSCVTLLEKSFCLSSLPTPQDCLSVKKKMQTVGLSRITLFAQELKVQFNKCQVYNNYNQAARLFLTRVTPEEVTKFTQQ